MNVNCGLVVCCGGENLTLLCRNRGISLDQLGSDSAQCLDGQAQRSNIQQQYVIDLTGQYAGLNGCTDCNALIRVDALERFLTGYSLYRSLYCRDTCGTTDQDNLVQVCRSNAGISHCLVHRLDGSVYQIGSELIESRSGQVHIQMQRTVSGYGDERQVNLCGLCAGQFLLCLLCGFLQSLQCHVVLSQVHAVLLLEGVCQEVHDLVIEVIAAQVCITVGCQYFENAVAQFQYGYIECTAAQVIYQNLVRSLCLVQAVCQRSCGRLVDNSLYIQSGNLTGIFGCLLLCIGEVCRYGDYRFGNLLAQIAFRICLQLCQDHCGNILRCVLLSVDFYVIVLTHVSLNGCDGSVRVGDGLSLCGLTYQSLSVLCECHYGRGGSCTLCVSDYGRFSTFQYSDTAVCCSQINSNYFAHFYYLSFLEITLLLRP